MLIFAILCPIICSNSIFFLCSKKMELIGPLENVVKTENNHVNEEIDDEESCHICGTMLDKYSLESHATRHLL